MSFTISGKELCNVHLLNAFQKLMVASHYKDHKQSFRINRMAHQMDKLLAGYRTEMKQGFEAAARGLGLDISEPAKLQVTPDLEQAARDLKKMMDAVEYKIDFPRLSAEDLGPVIFTPAELEALVPMVDPSYFSAQSL